MQLSSAAEAPRLQRVRLCLQMMTPRVGQRVSSSFRNRYHKLSLIHLSNFFFWKPSSSQQGVLNLQFCDCLRAWWGWNIRIAPRQNNDLLEFRANICTRDRESQRVGERMKKSKYKMQSWQQRTGTDASTVKRRAVLPKLTYNLCIRELSHVQDK